MRDYTRPLDLKNGRVEMAHGAGGHWPLGLGRAAELSWLNGSGEIAGCCPAIR